MTFEKCEKWASSRDKCRWRKDLRCLAFFHTGFSRVVQNRVYIYTFMQPVSVGISTLSTWFSTGKALILLEKTHLCGKLDVEIPLHKAFSTCGSVVENHGLFVENSRKSYDCFSLNVTYL